MFIPLVSTDSATYELGLFLCVSVTPSGVSECPPWMAVMKNVGGVLKTPHKAPGTQQAVYAFIM